ncbi:MAG: hypothetical protein ACPGGK_04875 [Pikeienuella sp.]
MQRILLSFMLVASVACAPAPQKKATGPTAFDKTVDKSCYTVEIDSPAKIKKPAPTVPTALRALSGRWGGGAWGGQWCHDLHVLSVEPDGRAVVIEAHAPYEPWGKNATAFRRNANVSSDGTLRMIYKGVVIEYWVASDGSLHGVRKEGDIEHKIKLSRDNDA